MQGWAALVVATGCSFTPGTLGGTPRLDGDIDAADGASDTMGDGSGAMAAVTAEFGERAGATHAGVTTDSYVESMFPTTPQGANVSVWADASPTTNGLLRFDLTAVPVGSTVTKADLLIATNVDSLESGMMQVYAALEDWDEATATWNERTTGVAWTTLGASTPGSRGTTLLGEVFPNVDETPYTVAMDVATISGWIDQPTTNHGMVLISTSPSGNGVTFHSSEDPTQAVRPALRLTYTPP